MKSSARALRPVAAASLAAKQYDQLSDTCKKALDSRKK
jgi:hypothetical protein